MGGFVVDLSSIHNTLQEVVLTYSAVAELARRGHFIDDVSSNAIKDKSKANLLAKGLVVCQVSWLVVQSIARYRSGLPLSLLEIHTLIHVFCALWMYILWWWKPKDIGGPNLIDITSVYGDLAEMLIFNKPHYGVIVEGVSSVVTNRIHSKD